jgi:hypothetical protein
MEEREKNQSIHRKNAGYLQQQSAALLEDPSEQQLGRYREFLALVTNGRYLHQIFLKDAHCSDTAAFIAAEEDANAVYNHNVTRLPPQSAAQCMGLLVDKQLGIVQNTYRLALDLNTAKINQVVEAVSLVHVLATTLAQYQRKEPPAVSDYLSKLWQTPIKQT